MFFKIPLNKERNFICSSKSDILAMQILTLLGAGDTKEFQDCSFHQHRSKRQATIFFSRFHCTQSFCRRILSDQEQIRTSVWSRGGQLILPWGPHEKLGWF
uniref:Uncharacterized protein n=1 Tax=Micrurus spixii TaxID=129469 RepID=A0A2D4MDQ8_9SAUR